MIFGYIKLSKKRSNTRLETISVKKLLEYVNINYNKKNTPFENIFFNYNKFPSEMLIKINDLFYFYSYHGENRGVDLIKNNLYKKQEKEINNLQKEELIKIDKFCSYLKRKGYNIKNINRSLVIEKNNRIFRESEDIVNYISPERYLLQRGE